mgnify:CR=1 FL=1
MTKRKKVAIIATLLTATLISGCGKDQGKKDTDKGVGSPMQCRVDTAYAETNSSLCTDSDGMMWGYSPLIPNEHYKVVFDTMGTDDVTDDVIISVSIIPVEPPCNNGSTK